MDRSEGPQSPVETEGVSEGGTLDMDFIKSFLNKTDEDPADSKRWIHHYATADSVICITRTPISTGISSIIP